MNNPRVLHLTLHWQWFVLIAAGYKVEEYREIKEYWSKRLEGREYDEIAFTNGYGSHRPFMRVKWEGLKYATWKNERVYAIPLGGIIEMKNYSVEEAVSYMDSLSPTQKDAWLAEVASVVHLL